MVDLWHNKGLVPDARVSWKEFYIEAFPDMDHEDIEHEDNHSDCSHISEGELGQLTVHSFSQVQKDHYVRQKYGQQDTAGRQSHSLPRDAYANPKYQQLKNIKHSSIIQSIITRTDYLLNEEK